MKKKFLTLLASSIAVISLSACDSKTSSYVTTVDDGVYSEVDFRGEGYLENDYFALKKSFYNLSVGGSESIVVETLPTAYAANSLEFISNDTSIVTVDETGKLTGVKKGIADVSVKAKDGSISSKVRVAVSASSTKDASQSVIDSINEAYGEGHVAPRKCIKYEYSYEMYSKEGVKDHGTENYESMAFDMDTGYFRYAGPSLYLKTPNGTPEIQDGTWIFYPINYGLFTRLIHITPTKKNYFDINTASYETNYQIIYDILNFFFVSGQDIAIDFMEAFDGKKDFAQSVGYSSTSFYSIDDSSLILSLKEESSDTVECKDEINSFDIPTDTVYDYVFNETFLNAGNKTQARNIDMVMSYKLGNENWTREFGRFELYDDDFDQTKIQDPKENGFQSVDSIYDL